MKRNEFIRYLSSYNCQLYREGGNYSVFRNTINNKQTAVPRHSELSDLLCKKICKQLEIPDIKKRKVALVFFYNEILLKNSACCFIEAASTDFISAI